MIGVTVGALDDRHQQLCSTVRIEPEQLERIVNIAPTYKIGEEPNLPSRDVSETMFGCVFHNCGLLIVNR